VVNGSPLQSVAEGGNVHVQCANGFMFIDGTNTKTFTCSGGTWGPDPDVAICVSTAHAGL